MVVSRRFVPIAGVAAVLIAGIVAWLLLRPAPPKEGSEEFLIAGVIEDLDLSPSVSLILTEESLPGARDVIAQQIVDAALAAPDDRIWWPATSRNVIEPSHDQREKLAQLFADWITLRSQADAEAYLRWMREIGCELRADSPPDFSLAGLYESLNGQPASPESTREQLFAGCFEAPLHSLRRGMMQPTELSGLDIRFGACRSLSPDIETELLGDEPRTRWWVGREISTGLRLFDNPVTYTQLQARHRALDCAAIYAGVVGKNGARMTLRFYAYWDPGAQRWLIDSVAVMSLQQSLRGTGIVY